MERSGIWGWSVSCFLEMDTFTEDGLGSLLIPASNLITVVIKIICFDAGVDENDRFSHWTKMDSDKATTVGVQVFD
jgi:hypothetical protein